MGNKTRAKSRKMKNRGGDRLREFRISREFNRNNLSDLHDQTLSNSRDYTNDSVEGRRVIDVVYFIEQLKVMSDHAPHFGCTLKNFILRSEVKRGLRSGFCFECNMCGAKETVWSEKESTSLDLDINSAAVAGVVSSGGGFSNLQKLLGAMNIRCMNYRIFEKHEEIVSKGWEESALQEMKKAATEEISLARERGDVDKDGVPLLTVVADGSWAKRSYRTNYNSLSGVAAIVGYHTRKVIYFGVKNKYCVTCARASKNTNAVKDHVCFKNWSGSSSSMEAATIVEGFLSSEEMYGVRYCKIIADGDSSVYHNILTARPYDNLTVIKVECRNHLLRNFANKLREVVITSVRGNAAADFDRGAHLKLRKIVGANIFRCRNAVVKAIKHRKIEECSQFSKSQNLKGDILNMPSHVFGEHLHCQELGYFCNGRKENEVNHMPAMMKLGIYSKIMEAVNVLADNCHHLIQDVDSNIVEHYNASIARFTGGKRVNYSQKGSYKTRCAAAVVSYNAGRAFHSLHKAITKNSPTGYSKLYEARSRRKIELAAKRNRAIPKVRRKLLLPSTNDKDYGPNSQKPDLSEVMFESKAKDFMERLKKTEQERNEIEILTRNQYENQVWFEERRLRLTASNFGIVCNRKPHTKCSALVKSLLYSSKIDTEATQYGKTNEQKALMELQQNYNVKVLQCGLFIDANFPFLAATPDGVIDDDEGIVEVKCPATTAHLTPDEIINNKVGIVGSMWNGSTEKGITVKPMHNYHIQVQGQLHITNRRYCLFSMWTPHGLRVERIEKNDTFWEEVMLPKLKTFYTTCMLPELVDPRFRRHMEIKEPSHILEAIAKKEENKLKKLRKN